MAWMGTKGKTLAAGFGSEEFSYVVSDIGGDVQENGKRRRARCVVAVIAPLSAGCSGVGLPIAADSSAEKSYSRYHSTTGKPDIASTKGQAADFFLVNQHDGHLLGSQFGGPRNRKNLVPMDQKSNTGGKWKTFESAAANYLESHRPTKTHVTLLLYVAAADYTGTQDPRFPTACLAGFLPFTVPLQKVATVLTSLNKSAVATQILKANSELGLKTILKDRQTWFVQSPDAVFLENDITTARAEFSTIPEFDNEGIASLEANLKALMLKHFAKDMDPKALDFDKLAAPVETVIDELGLEALNPKNQYSYDDVMVLPPKGKRPYGFLDMLCLTDWAAFLKCDDRTFGVKYTAAVNESSFPLWMRRYLFAANRILAKAAIAEWKVGKAQELSIDDLVALKADALDDEGGLPAGNLAIAEADHIVPRAGVVRPDWIVPAQMLGPPYSNGRLPGATMFSNVQLTSRGYNSSKKATVGFSVNELTYIGRRKKGFSMFNVENLNVRQRDDLDDDDDDIDILLKKRH